MQIRKNPHAINFSSKINVQKLHQNPFITQKSRLNADVFSFTGNVSNTGKLNSVTAEYVANTLAGATAGFRNQYIKESTPGTKGFTKEAVSTITDAASAYAVTNGFNIFIIGGDTREATKRFSPDIINQLLNNGFDVYYPNAETPEGIANMIETGNIECLKLPVKPVATPLLALAARELNADLGVLLTASHNPWEDAGFNFVTPDAAIAPAEVTNDIAENIKKIGNNKDINIKASNKKGELKTYNPYAIYKNHIDNNIGIDWDSIRNANITIGYDSLKGTGSYYFPKLLKDHGVEIKFALDTKTEGPNPTARNLTNLAQKLKETEGNMKLGLATDGDSDRFGLIDENGKFISADDVLLLVLHHMVENRGNHEGKVIRSQATSSQLDLLAEKNGLEVIQTPVGFKYIGEKMLELEKEDVPTILAGEESGGGTIKDHIPEKDGYAILLMLLEMVAQEGKPVGQILKDVKKGLGADFKLNRIDLDFNSQEDKVGIVKEFEKFLTGEATEFAGIRVDLDKTLEEREKIKEFKKNGDGIKLYFEDGSSVLVRQSGTENLARIYIQARGEDSDSAAEKFDQFEMAAMELGDKYNGTPKSH